MNQKLIRISLILFFGLLLHPYYSDVYFLFLTNKKYPNWTTRGLVSTFQKLSSPVYFTSLFPEWIHFVSTPLLSCLYSIHFLGHECADYLLFLTLFVHSFREYWMKGKLLNCMWSFEGKLWPC